MEQNLAIGIDIGGTNTSFGIIDERGQILYKGGMPTTGHGQIADFIGALQQKLSPLLLQLPKERLTGVGVGAPNANFYTGEIREAVNLPWKGVVPLAALLTEAFQLKTTITNDANAAALGEMYYGAAKGMKDFVVVTLGTGLGSGFVANGQLIYGHDGFAGELGHITAVREGRLCNCGRKGCLERYVSATGLVLTAQEWLREKTEASTLRHLKELSAKAVHEAARSGDKLAIEMLAYTGSILGQALADVVAITSPEAFIFFGGVAAAGDLLLRPAKEHMERNLLHIFRDKVAFHTSALPAADAAILGASALVWAR